MKCPKYHVSVELLGEYGGFAQLEQEVMAAADACWRDSPLRSNAPEDTPAVETSGRSGRRKISAFRHLCPEVAGDRFGLFCSDLGKPPGDELDMELREAQLLRENTPLGHPRWTWEYLIPLHYYECSLYSLLSHAAERETIRLPRQLPFDALSGNEFEELVYAYLNSGAERQWTSLVWVGRRGHDGGRDIWAVAEDGSTWCFLCANHRRLRPRKVKEDLDALYNWSRQPGQAPPQHVVIVAGDKDIGAGMRDDAEEEARERGWGAASAFQLWSGAELEVKLKDKCPDIAQRFFVSHLVSISERGPSGRGGQGKG
jgi:hypothetical protein